jgi:hypothetical protein
LQEYASTFSTFKEYKIHDNFKKVVVGSDTYSCFCGIAFYNKQGKELLSIGKIRNPVETILDDDERIVGIVSRNEEIAEQYDF